MTYSLNEYQEESRKTAKYPVIGHRVIYPLLGLLGETGEIAEKIKKMFRDRNGELTPEEKDLLKKEIGDVMWYIAQLATELDLKLEDIAIDNIAKLRSRMERGTLGGSGDKR